MKNKELLVFERLLQLLNERPKNTRYYKHLKILAEHTLYFYENNGQDFDKISMSKKDIVTSEFEENPNHPQADNTDAVNPKKIKSELDYFIYSDSGIIQDFLDLGYIPHFKEDKSDGGSGKPSYYSLIIRKIDEENKFLERSSCVYKIRYEHIDKSLVKLSLFSKLFFDKNHELKMRSFKGIFLLLILLNSFFMYLLLISFLIVSIFFIPRLLDINLIVMPVVIIFFLLIFIHIIYSFHIPLNKIITHKIVKAPQFFIHLNQDNADIEFYKSAYKKDSDKEYKIARITEIRSICPICTAPILLMDGKPDQSAPLVGRCIEAPHAHVYSFDRMLMIGYFLGHPTYLQENQDSES